MTDEVKDMISKALGDEPPVGVSYETVLAAGRRRRARRQLGIIGGAVLGVAAVASSAVLVGQHNASPATNLAAPTTSAPPVASGGCAFPPGTGGFSDTSAGTVSAEELAESERLTAVFGRFPVPLPAGVSTDPAPRFCAIKDSWGMRINLHSPAGDRTVFIEVKAGIPNQVGLCPLPDQHASCTQRRLADGSSVRLSEVPAAKPNQPVLAGIDAWRADNTVVRVLETGAESPNPAPRVLDDEALVKIATMPQLKVDGPVRPLPREASAQRAAELDEFLAKSPVLGNGVFIPPGFVVSQGGYKLSVDLTDGAGTGSLFVNLNPPDSAPVDCHNEPGCDLITLPDKRKATITRVADKTSMRLSLSTKAADGTQVFITTTNRSDKSPDRTRPTPPLSDNDLIRIAGQTWLHW